MKKVVLIMSGLVMSLLSQSQTVQGSVRPGAASNQVEVVYLADHSRAGGGNDYVNYLSVSIAIPTSSASGVVPSISTAGTIFAPLTFLPASPFSYQSGTETIYSWLCSNGTPFAMSWALGVPFVGATITFSGPGHPTGRVKVIDFSNLSGGNNGNTFFNVGVAVAPFDLTNYADFFFTAAGSSEGTYAGSGDRFVETVALIALPASLLNFSGYKSGSKNVLRWTTANEQDNLGFELQRSTDGINYSVIGFVNSIAPGGNSSTQLSYSFDDNAPAASKKQYYRLRQSDISGGSKLSNTVVISRDKALVLGIGGLFPNPARSLVNVIIDAPGRENVTLIVMDVNGKTVKQQMANVETGSNTIPVEISDLASGSYLVKVICKSDCETAVAKFNKQ